MWPFKRTPVKTIEQIAAEKPPAPCGRQVSHYEWEIGTGVGCPHCAGIRDAARKQRNRELLAEAIADAIVRKLKEWKP
jgi:hypothetical protein